MTPSTALTDPVFLRFVWIIPGVFIFAGAVLMMIQFGFGKNLGSIWLIYRSWWVMGLLGLGVVFGGTIPILVSIALLGAFGFQELGRASALPRLLVWLCSVSIALLALLAPLTRSENTWQGAAGSILPGFVVVIFLFALANGRVDAGLRKAGVAVAGFILLGMLFTQLGPLTRLGHPYGPICYVIFSTELSDVAAFICGRLFGRHLLAPEISPRKTWEGAFGALGVSMILPWLLRFALPGFGPVHLVATGLIIGVGGQLGDLSVSVIKRALQTKDMGTLIPGHGGILDRIDSLIYVAPLFMQVAARCDALK